MSGLDLELLSTLSQSSIPDLASVDEILSAHLDGLTKEKGEEDGTGSERAVDEAMEGHPSEPEFDPTTLSPEEDQSWTDNWSFPGTLENLLVASSFGATSATSLNSGYAQTVAHTPGGLTSAALSSEIEPFVFSNPAMPGYALTAFSLPLTHSHTPMWPMPADYTAPYIPSGLLQDPFSVNQVQEEMPSVPDWNKKSGLKGFIPQWAQCAGLLSEPPPNISEWKSIIAAQRASVLERETLNLKEEDVQGVDWQRIGTTRKQARSIRRQLSSMGYAARHYKSHRRPQSEETFFKFRRISTKHRPFVNHYQLRNLIAATSPNDVYFTTQSKRQCAIMRADTPDTSTCIMNLSKTTDGYFGTTCLCASNDVIIAGGFDGSYAYTFLNSELGGKHVDGQVTSVYNGITNHVHTFNDRRNGRTQAAFCSNDMSLRILDCFTNQFTLEFKYDFLVNCSATSPNGQMRIVVGDGVPGESHRTIITRADNGQTIHTMQDHDQDSFACAWSGDGIYYATAAQDERVQIYDARFWDRPLTTIFSGFSQPRSLCFSPLGSGRSLLYIAEQDDIVTVVDGKDFQKCQVLDSFGELGGMSLTPDGQTLFVANCDKEFGGLLEYQRCEFDMDANMGLDSWSARREVSNDLVV